MNIMDLLVESGKVCFDEFQTATLNRTPVLFKGSARVR